MGGSFHLHADPAALSPTPNEILWTVTNGVLALAIPAAIVFAIVYVVRLGQRVRRLEEQLNQNQD